MVVMAHWYVLLHCFQGRCMIQKSPKMFEICPGTAHGIAYGNRTMHTAHTAACWTVTATSKQAAQANTAAQPPLPTSACIAACWAEYEANTLVLASLLKKTQMRVAIIVLQITVTAAVARAAAAVVQNPPIRMPCNLSECGTPGCRIS